MGRRGGKEAARLVGQGSEGAREWPRPFLLAHRTVPVPGAPGSSARPRGLRPKPMFPLCIARAPLPQACSGRLLMPLPGLLGGSLELQEPAQRCQGGVPGEAVCALWAWVAGDVPAVPQPRLSARSISPASGPGCVCVATGARAVTLGR